MKVFLIVLIFLCFENVFATEFEPESLDSNEVLNIVGGKKSVRNSWPWTATLSLEELGMKQCGATIINSKWLITAGHCFSEYIFKSDWTVEIGAYENGDDVEKHKIDEVFIHEKFDNKNYTFNDIALIRLKNTINSTFKSLSLVNYEMMERLEDFDRCITIGWGADHVKPDKTFDESKYLREVEIKLYDVYECSKHFQPFRIDPNTQICAGGDGKGTCFGDSGSSLQCWHISSEQWFLVGITSFGIPCGKPGIPDAFTSVAAFNEWIFETIKNNKKQ